MKPVFEVSFNSPQCGWMSIGFEHPGGEFHTTTSHAPHKQALSEILRTVKDILVSETGYQNILKWNRDPEEYDFLFSTDGTMATIAITEYPTPERNDGECVYTFEGDPFVIAKGFTETFQQMYDERDIDEFEENWHQKFPYEAFEALKTAVANHGR